MKNYNITVNGRSYSVSVEEAVQQKAAPAAASAAAASIVTSPLDGTVSSLSVKAGVSVVAGALLMLISEAGSETEILAPVNGVVSGVCVSEGSLVRKGDSLVKF